jgi:hypothetical protein
MQSLSVLNEVVKALETHENALRIKKMMWCICNQVWENDPNKLNELNVKDLVQDLRQINPTLEDLKNTLYQVVKTLNKPGEYSLVAKIIYLNIGKLYPEAQKLNQSRSSGGNELNTAIQYAPRQPFTTKPEFKQNENRQAYDPFALRLQVMNYTNPLRAKILLFSILYHPFGFSKQDWSSLKAYELDELLQSLFSACSTLTELESKLHSVAQKLEEPEKNMQTATAIINSFKPFYTSLQLDNNLDNSEVTQFRIK